MEWSDNMGRKRKTTNYRQYYKDYYGIEFGPDMVVHHIDFDRSNNDIRNLLLLPNRLHTKYHFVIQTLFGCEMDKSLLKGLQLTGPMVAIHNVKWLKIMAETLEEIQPWMQMKVDFEMLPEHIFKKVYRTGSPITERSVM